MKPLEIIVVAIGLLFAECTMHAGTEPVNVNTANGHVKQTSSGTGATDKPFDFSDVRVIGILPSPSPSGTYVLGAVDGVLQWLPTTSCPSPTPTPTSTPTPTPTPP